MGVGGGGCVRTAVGAGLVSAGAELGNGGGICVGTSAGVEVGVVSADPELGEGIIVGLGVALGVAQELTSIATDITNGRINCFINILWLFPIVTLFVELVFRET